MRAWNRLCRADKVSSLSFGRGKNSEKASQEAAMGELVVVCFSDTSAPAMVLDLCGPGESLGMPLGTPESFPRKVTAVLQFPKMSMCMDPARCTEHVLRTPVWEIRDRMGHCHRLPWHQQTHKPSLS